MSGDATMQDVTEQAAPETSTCRSSPLPELLVSSGSHCAAPQLATQQAPAAVAAAPAAAAAAPDDKAFTQLDAATASKLQNAFGSREKALTWLAGDGYAKSKAALLPLGITDCWQVALLQAQQLRGLPGLLPVAGIKMSLILNNLISDAQRVELVYEQHRSWLQDHLGWIEQVPPV